MRLPKDWTAIEPGETDVVSIDFAKELASGETIQSTSWTCAVAAESAATDASASTRLSGSPTVTGTISAQKVTGMLNGVTYVLEATVVTSSSRTLQNHAHIYCSVAR